MILRFIIPADQAKRINGFLRSPVERLRLQGGKIYRGKQPFTLDKFLSGRDNFGAVLVTPDRGAAIAGLGVKAIGFGVQQGLTESEYARAHGVTRQAVHQQVKAGKLKTFNVGGFTFIETVGEVVNG